MDAAATKKVMINVVNIIWSFDFSTNKVVVLLVESSLKKTHGKWGLPTTMLRNDENAEAASLRLIREKIGIDLPHFYTEQLATFSDVDRSANGREIALTYMTYLPSMPKLTPGYGAKDAEWFAVGYTDNEYTLKYNNLKFKTLNNKIKVNEFYSDIKNYAKKTKLVSDHSLILRLAFKRITNRLNYLPTILLILGDSFTLKKARIVYATFLKEKLDSIDNSNFRKTHSHLFQEVGVEHGKSGRPAKLYKLQQFLDPR